MSSAPEGRPRRLALKILGSMGFFLVLLEVGLQVVFRVREGQWPVSRTAPPLFQPHPYRVASPIPSATGKRGGVAVSHNSAGLRGPELSPKRPGVRRVVAIGGSSTYCVRVTDEFTWPLLLSARLGEGWEVVNFGVPGYTSAEHVVQTALGLTELDPDLCIYYIGWNDVRSSHVLGLRADYSDFHGLGLAENLGLDEPTGALARSGILRAMTKVGNTAYRTLPNLYRRPKPGKDALTASVDSRALGIYLRNVRLIVANCRAQGIRCAFIPQVFDPTELTKDAQRDEWIPFLKDVDIPLVVEAYNRALAEVCREVGVPCWESAQLRFEKVDFVDRVHFSPTGTAKLARSLEPFVRSIPLEGD